MCSAFYFSYCCCCCRNIGCDRLYATVDHLTGIPESLYTTYYLDPLSDLVSEVLSPILFAFVIYRHL